jgi:feruloyl-CoA synthase
MELFATPRTLTERSQDGSMLLRSALPLGPYENSMAVPFRKGAREHPERVLVAERAGRDWRRVTWGAALDAVNGLAQALLDRDAAGRPVMILSGNSVEHLLLTLACYTVGSPAVPVSTAYSLLDPGHAKLRAMADLIDPAVVFADDPESFSGALKVAGGEVLAGREEFERWTRTVPTPRVDEASAAVGPDTLAKILFTSGSTGLPKGVMNTHRMLCANQRMLRRIWPFLAEEAPVLLDWLPWSHTFGGNHNLGLVIANGGSLYIDDGRPGPEPVKRTAAKSAGRPGTRRGVLRPDAVRVLRGGRAAAARLGRHRRGGSLGRLVRGDDDLVGRDRDRPGGDLGLLRLRTQRLHRRPAAGSGDQAGAGGAEAGDPGEGAVGHRGLLRRPRADRCGLRRGRLLPDR